MGFSIYYRSTRPITEAEADAIARDTRIACEGRSWLSCEPVHFFNDREDGHLLGGSKPNFTPHPDDAASAVQSGQPDGTTVDLIDVLCGLSRGHRVDWVISHDADPEPIGYIRAGECDPKVRTQIETLAEVGGMIAGEWEEFEGD